MKDHYDICIAGFWYGANYGSMLNGYAEYCLLKKGFGKEVLMLQKPRVMDNDPEITLGHNTDFVKKYYDPEDISPSLSYDQLRELNGICDCFCAGSDQIWNYNLSFHENMYLPFVSDNKKIISFATSFGHKEDRTPVESRERIKKYFQRYDAISVREQFDVEIMNNNYDVRAELVFEPVFCIDKQYYYHLIDKAEFSEDEPYLLTYILDPTPIIRDAIEKYSKVLNLKVINILDGDSRKLEKNERVLNLPNMYHDVSVENFLKAFYGADFIITDSFHGSAFSIIFNKQFIAIGNRFRGLDRFLDLFGRLQLMDRLILDPEKIPVQQSYMVPIDYTETNRIIEFESSKTVDWLKRAVEQPKEEFSSICLFTGDVGHTVNSLSCSGCSACVCICPVDAISLEPDQWGFYRRHVDYDLCVKCSRCTNICPALDLPINENYKQPVCFEFVASDESVLRNSSSGGAFTSLARLVFEKKGIVFGAAWKDDFSVEQIAVDNEDDLYKLQKSKYLQSYLGICFREVKSFLEAGRFVLFTGTPCQVTGLRSYLGKNYENLITVDIFCSNAPSQWFFKKYLDSSFPNGIGGYEFRYKKPEWNWDCTTVKVCANNGNEMIHHGSKDDDFQRVFHNHTMCSYHCEKCHYQNVPRSGDLTLGDFWGIEKKDKTIETKKGVSVILVNSEKGLLFLKSLPESSYIIKKEVPFEWTSGNGYALPGSKSYAPHSRDLFFDAIQRMPFKQAVNYSLKPNHGQFRLSYCNTNNALRFDCNMLHFHFEKDYWEELIIEGRTTLIVKDNKWNELGHYARLSMACMLEKYKTYVMSVKFKVKSNSDYLNFHIIDSGSKIFQVIHSEKIAGRNNGEHWIEFHKRFVPDTDFYDEFMIGAKQISGKNNYLMFAYIDISEDY